MTVFRFIACWCLVFCLLSASCDWLSGNREPPPSTRPPAASVDPLSLLRGFAHDGREWNLYLTADGFFWRDREKFYAYALLQAGEKTASMHSALVLLPAVLPPGKEVPVVFHAIEGVIFELHVVRLGSSFENQLLFTSFARQAGEERHLSSVYWDVVREGKEWRFQEAWRVVHVYDIQDARSYGPPDFHYWDVDDDGLQEIVVTNRWKDAVPPWKHRWAVFHWNAEEKRVEARRGMAYFPFREQHPEWMALALVEMQRLKRPEEEITLHFSSAPGCETRRSLYAVAAFDGALSPPRTVRQDGQTAWVRLDGKPVKDSRENLRLEFELRNDPLETDRWRVCRVQLFRVHTP